MFPSTETGVETPGNVGGLGLRKRRVRCDPASGKHSQTCLFTRAILAGLRATPSSILGDPAVPGIEPWASHVQSVH